MDSGQKTFCDLPFFGVKYFVDGSTRICGVRDFSLRKTNLPEECVFWRWDGERLVVQNDRLGFYPLYYASFDHAFFVSNSIPKLLSLGVPRELDYDALSVFLRLGFFIGEDTPFKAIRAFPPGAVFTFERGCLKKEVKGFLTGSGILNQAHGDIVKEYVGLFQKAVSKRLPAYQDSFGICLSGGRDSRHILFELLRHGYRPVQCVTTQKFFSDQDPDVSLAKIVADRTGVNLKVFDNRVRTFKDDISVFYLTSFCSDEHFWMAHLVDAVDSQVSCLYDGIGVDVYLSAERVDDSTKKFCREADWDGLAAYILNKTSESFKSDHFFSEIFLEKISFRRAHSRLLKELEKHKDAIEPCLNFYFWNRTRREIALAPFGILGRKFEIQTPFLDIDLLTFIFSLPKEELYRGRLRDDAILSAYPDWADTPFALSSGNAGKTFSYAKSCVRYLFFYVLRGRNLNKKFLFPRFVLLFFSLTYKRFYWILDPKLIYICVLEIFVKKNRRSLVQWRNGNLVSNQKNNSLGLETGECL